MKSKRKAREPFNMCKTLEINELDIRGGSMMSRIIGSLFITIYMYVICVWNDRNARPNVPVITML